MSGKPLTSEQLTELTAGLNKLARNLWWTWDEGAQEFFEDLSPRGWQNLYHNAVAVLHEVSEQELRVRLEEPLFAEKVRSVLRAFDLYMTERPTWGDLHAAPLQSNPVAYFSAEFGFHETLPIAAGGLGILAGDHAKSASDSGIGFVGISLFYRQVEIGMSQVLFQAWRVNVGRVPVYLLDANRQVNEQHFRDLTLRVYGGDSTTRIMQEMLLGIGGVRLL